MDDAVKLTPQQEAFNRQAAWFESRVRPLSPMERAEMASFWNAGCSFVADQPPPASPVAKGPEGSAGYRQAMEGQS